MDEHCCRLNGLDTKLKMFEEKFLAVNRQLEGIHH
jgi:hypothetical protein